MPDSGGSVRTTVAAAVVVAVACLVLAGVYFDLLTGGILLVFQRNPGDAAIGLFVVGAFAFFGGFFAVCIQAALCQGAKEVLSKYSIAALMLVPSLVTLSGLAMLIRLFLG